MFIPCSQQPDTEDDIQVTFQNSGAHAEYAWYDKEGYRWNFWIVAENGEQTYFNVIFHPMHHYVETLAKAPTCTENGNIQYWTCSVCHKFFDEPNEYCEISQDETVIPTVHTLTETPAKAATCTEAGNLEYWTCSVCEKTFSALRAKPSWKAQ